MSIAPHPTPEEFQKARAIVDSSPVLSVYAACEWNGLDEDGRVWIATIVREAMAQAWPVADVIVPGALRCPKCDFRLQKITLHLLDGSATANNEPDRCPNCNVPMWRVSWKDEAQDAYRTAESQMERARNAEKNLELALRTTGGEAA